MKKLSLLPLLIFAIVLAGCNKPEQVIQVPAPTPTPTQTQPIILNETAEERVFRLNQECLKLRDQLERRIQELANEFALDNEERSLEEVFYSPKTNSCLYVSYRLFTWDIAGSIYRSYAKKLYEVGKDAGHITPMESCSADYPKSAEIKKRDIELFGSSDEDLTGCDNFDQKISEYYKKP